MAVTETARWRLLSERIRAGRRFEIRHYMKRGHLYGKSWFSTRAEMNLILDVMADDHPEVVRHTFFDHESKRRIYPKST
jgi:hypothetical protein